MSSSSQSLPVSKIPGSYGVPLLGPLMDRLDYFWFEGADTFFRKRVDKYKSTVFRTNMPPTFPFFFGINPNVIAVLDIKSYAHVFDMELVEKKNIAIGEFVPTLDYTGGIRPCVYLDTAETKHATVKKFFMDILHRNTNIWAPTIVSKLDVMWDSIESNLSKSGSASFEHPMEQFTFSYLCRCLFGADTGNSPEIAESGYSMLKSWIGIQFFPVVKPGLLIQPFEEIFLHSFPFPFFLVKSKYKKLFNFVEKEAKEAIDIAETEYKLGRDEAIHQLIFMLGLNATLAFTGFFPHLMKNLASDKKTQERLRKEVRENCGPTLSLDSIKGMELLQSYVYEMFRFHPPAPRQFGRARKDFLLSSHDTAYEIKKGELLVGFEAVVLRDPKVFDNPETFDPDRFTKERGGKELLNYLYCWNGPPTGTPSESNKMCAGKDFTIEMTRLFVAYIFLRYDSITCNSSGAITALEKAK